MGECDREALAAAGNEKLFEEFVGRQKPFIIRCASAAAGRYITESDDEYSLALIAFSDAVRCYDLEKGDFKKYAGLVIRRRIIDFYRRESRRAPEYPVNPAVFGPEPDDQTGDRLVGNEIAEKLIQNEDSSIRYEIETVASELRRFGFSFYDIAGSSPRSKKTKAACRTAVRYILQNPPLAEDIRRSRQLPVKIIQENTGLPRKLIERHRKYIIAAMLILSGDYPQLAEYVAYISDGEG